MLEVGIVDTTCGPCFSLRRMLVFGIVATTWGPCFSLQREGFATPPLMRTLEVTWLESQFILNECPSCLLPSSAPLLGLFMAWMGH